MIKKLIMLLFVALAIGMAIPSTRQQMVDRLTPIKDNVGARLVPRRLDVMADMIDVRLQRAEGLPPRFDGWLRRDYTGSEFDPWGNLYYLQAGRTNYTVGSMGPDAKQGTDDDITETRSLDLSRR